MEGHRLLLLVHHEKMGNRKLITQRLDNTAWVLNWFSPFERAIFIVTDRDVTSVRNSFCETFKDILFLLLEVDSGKIDGLILSTLWGEILHPKPSGSHFLAKSKEALLPYYPNT